MMATNGGQVAIAELLVNMGADVTITDKVKRLVFRLS
jgi:predicted Fe-Mo cluster-binding NifX family protein